MTIQAVIFDVGNVLIEWQPERFYDSVIGEERRKKMFSEVDLHGMNELVDLGHPFKETIYKAAEKYPNWTAEIQMWHDQWIEMASPVIEHSVHLLHTLRSKGTPVFSLTNFGIQSYDYAETKYPFLGDFDQDYISGHMAVTKPNPKIYQMVEEGCGLAPETLLFADDSTDNIDAANARGWQTHLFEHPQDWAETLVNHGLLTKTEAAF
jgi:2-haloacid dehalogenase